MSNFLDTLFFYIRDHAISYKKEGAVIAGKDGQPQAWIMDLRMASMNAQFLDSFCDLFWDRYQDKLPFQFGGMEVAAIPLVVGLMMKATRRGLKTNGFIIRKDRKSTGLGRIIEGILNDDPIILIDDLVNSGSSLEKSRIILAQQGRSIKEVFAIVDYESAAGMAWRQQCHIPVSSLFRLSEFGLSIDKPLAPMEYRYEISWRHHTPGAYPFHLVPKSGLLVVGNNIYMGTSTAKMVCINRHTGKIVWEYFAKGAQNNPKGIMSSPAYHDGRIYFGAYNGVVYCLDAQTGQEIWLNPCCEWVGSSPLIVPKNNLLYIGLEYQRPRMMGSNAALRLDNGARVWEVAQKKYQHGSAAYYEPKDMVIFGNANHDITAYEAKTGKEVWQFKTKRSIKYAPTIDYGRKLIASSSFDGNIYINDVETGVLKASIPTDDICYATPLFAGNKIFCGSGDRHMYIIDADTLTLIKKMDCGARVFSSPIRVDKNIIFGTNGGKVLEIDGETLNIIGNFQLPDAVANRVILSSEGDGLYVRTCMDELYGIKRMQR